MPKIDSFEKYWKAYDAWFERNYSLYKNEVQTLKNLVGNTQNGLEIGVGTGRFALDIGITIGLEPSEKMRNVAKSKGLTVVDGIAENLPFDNNKFDFAIMVNTICFVDDLSRSFQEAFRVIKDNGFLVVGYIDKNSKLGLEYQEKSHRSKFYSNAHFYSSDEIMTLLKVNGFSSFKSEYVDKTKESVLFLKAYK